MAMNIVSGNDGSNALSGTSGNDLIYGFDPNADYSSATLSATSVASGLSQPLYVTFAPGDTSRLFIVEKTGSIKILDLNTGEVLADPFLTVDVGTFSERGLLGLAFDPDYATNGYFYIYRTSTDGQNEVLRYSVSSDPNIAGTGEVILTVGPSTVGNRNAGWLGFGSDGYLYISSGDSGVPSNAQDTTNLAGKILRIDVDALTYEIPADNPFAGTGGGVREEIYAYGLRNPWRASFDSATGTFYVTDVGQLAFEEINIGQSGVNYGWPTAEGISSNPDFVNAIYTYPHGGGAALTGGYVYRGESDGLQGQYFFADYIKGTLSTLRFDGTEWVATDRTAQIVSDSGTVNAIASFGEDALGNLYAVSIAGEVFRIEATVESADIRDTLLGFGGDDRLFSGGGGDFLDGGTGADFMNGGEGDDRFIYRPGYGADVIYGFATGAGSDDKVSLGSFTNILSLGDVLSRATQVNADTVIDFGNGDTLTLRNVTVGSLDASDFIFAQAGTSGDDDFIVNGGSESFDAGTGVDTITFGFKLTEAVVTYSGNQVTIDGPSSHTVLSGFERFVFADGTVDNDDGNALVDDLFYYANNHDVWSAGGDADEHFNAFGWQENRDPNAFFSTSLYLLFNPDVQAAGINPLAYFDSVGWQEGDIPSFAFDPAQYLAAYPDVAAANIDPLLHFLEFGAEEGRQPFAVTNLIASNGFDYVYYLQNNPDVAAAGLDPLWHFNEYGWQEGRNPNALFDTAGYLANYADVAAANVNPLDHYHYFGWSEGRDPAVAFDTAQYLAAYPDVADAGVDPLWHFLYYGQFEGRTAFFDGTWS